MSTNRARTKPTHGTIKPLAITREAQVKLKKVVQSATKSAIKSASSDKKTTKSTTKKATNQVSIIRQKNTKSTTKEITKSASSELHQRVEDGAVTKCAVDLIALLFISSLPDPTNPEPNQFPGVKSEPKQFPGVKSEPKQFPGVKSEPRQCPGVKSEPQNAPSAPSTISEKNLPGPVTDDKAKHLAVSEWQIGIAAIMRNSGLGDLPSYLISRLNSITHAPDPGGSSDWDNDSDCKDSSFAQKFIDEALKSISPQKLAHTKPEIVAMLGRASRLRSKTSYKIFNDLCLSVHSGDKTGKFAPHPENYHPNRFRDLEEVDFKKESNLVFTEARKLIKKKMEDAKRESNKSSIKPARKLKKGKGDRVR